jgi:hypothetical protein
MMDSSSKPRAWKTYTITGTELKTALGIDWPGDILTIGRDYGGNGEDFEIDYYDPDLENKGKP